MVKENNEIFNVGDADSYGKAMDEIARLEALKNITDEQTDRLNTLIDICDQYVQSCESDE